MKKRILSIVLITVLLSGMFGVNTVAKVNDEFSVENIKFTYADTNTHAYTITAGKTIRVTADVTRNSAGGGGEICLAAVLYNTTNNMLGMVKSEAVSFKTGETKNVSVEYKLPSGVNTQNNYIMVYVLDAKDGITVYQCKDSKAMRFPEDKSGKEETVHLTVHNEKRQTLKGVGVSFSESNRVGGGFPRYNEGYEMLYSGDGANFNTLRLWLQLVSPGIEYNKDTGKIKITGGMYGFKSAYLDSGVIYTLEELRNNDLNIIITPSTVLPAEVRENAAQNVILNTSNLTQLRNAALRDGKIADIKNGGSAVFGGINVPNQYTAVRIKAGSESGGTVYLINADNDKIFASLPVEPTGGDDVVKEFTYERKISLNGTKNIKLSFESNGDSFGTFESLCVDGNTIIKTSKISLFTDMLAAYVDALKRDYDVTADCVSVFNEPLFHFTPEQLRIYVKELRKALDKRGLTAVKIIADEWAEIDEFTLYSWQELLKDKEALAAIDGLSFHSYQTHGLDYFEKVKDIFKAAGKEIWMTESSDTEILNVIEKGNYIQGAEQAARMLNDLNNYVEYWIHFFGVGWGSVGGGNNATSIIGVSKAEKDWLTQNGCYDYYKHIMDSFDYGCTFRYCTTTEYGDMARPRGKKPPINAAFAQNEDGSYTLALVNSSQARYVSEGWGKQNDNPYAITENVEIYIEELANVSEAEFDVFRSSPDGIYVNEGSTIVRNGKLSVTLEDSELLTLRSK